MKTLTDLFFRLAEALLVLMLCAMVVMVFGNVVLRYGFNSGLDFSEELSRFFFIWITFLGAIIAMREKAHLGLDTLVRLLPRAGRKVCFGLSKKNVGCVTGTRPLPSSATTNGLSSTSTRSAKPGATQAAR